jgi:predicted nuclease of restriction endonuclease-like RecB superfamily
LLTGQQVRVRHARHKLVPIYLPAHDPEVLAAAGQFVLAYREAAGKTRGELAELLADLLAEGPNQLVHQGFAKLLEDRCEFEVASEFPPEQIREAVFRLSAADRKAAKPFDRSAILDAAAAELKIPPEQVDVGLFADLKDEQRVLKFDDCSPEYLVRRYNVALAQALLIRSTGMDVRVTHESPARFRQLFRAVKFHKLICSIKPVPHGYALALDGPLSLFSATQKYGLQLALFLPTLMHCKSFSLTATLRWGAQRKEKTFEISTADGIESHTPDFGVYQPKELSVLAENFRKVVDDWTISDDPAPVPVGDEVWVPDFQLVRKEDGKVVFVEVLGYWRKVDLDRHLAKLRKHLPGEFVLAVGESNRAEAAGEIDVAPEIYRYKRTPSAAELAKYADSLTC